MNENIDNNYDVAYRDEKSRKDILIELRRKTGMNRTKFCAYLGIPYRTVSEWEKGGRVMPDYVLRLIEYRLRMEKMLGDEDAQAEDDVAEDGQAEEESEE